MLLNVAFIGWLVSLGSSPVEAIRSAREYMNELPALSKRWWSIFYYEVRAGPRLRAVALTEGLVT